jgi:DNA-binding NtrC family response regulator
MSVDSKPRSPLIMVVDDEVAMVRSLELLLKPLGQVLKAYSVPEADEYLQKWGSVDCIVTDVSMPEESGISFLERMRALRPEIPVIVITAFSSVPQAVEAMHKGAFEYLVKPFENEDLFSVVKRAIQSKGLTAGESRSMPSGWICNSRGMQEFLVKSEKLKDLSTPLLLMGETGVGKGRAARWMHEISQRSKKPFIAVDGRAHDEDSPLVTQSLSKAGTLFVAEILSLSTRLQDRVWDVIQEGKVRLIGSVSSGVELQRRKDFREDLFQAVTSMVLKVPSLRERAEDFEALVGQLCQGLAAKFQAKKLDVHPAAMAKLRTFNYPGNVRQLEQVLERAALEAKAQLITESDIHFDLGELKSLLPFTIPIENGWNRLEFLKESLEKELIQRALEKFPDQSNTEIALTLGTTRRILELRMKQYQLREGSSE